jgi:hypothetical protein
MPKSVSLEKYPDDLFKRMIGRRDSVNDRVRIWRWLDSSSVRRTTVRMSTFSEELDLAFQDLDSVGQHLAKTLRVIECW